MDKNTFIEQWVVTFLANWTLKEYDDACARGQQNRLKDPPIEDAFHLAEIQYNKVYDYAKEIQL